MIYQTVQDAIPAAVPDDDLRVVSQAMVGAINEVVVQNLFANGELVETDKSVDLDRLARLLNRIVVASYVHLARVHLARESADGK
ncbi:hypothetical protein [Effusibacillus pohliae]|uniref:hypothetical protein n=1 Tax=Effusibacillus pohliae TaxID=232270 RepID=UPI00037A9710|nr:hypothetical protein [Effusibacillus pohliae]